MSCPDSGRACEIVRLGTLELDLCDGCGGLWFDRNELERLPKELSPADPTGDIQALVARLADRKSASKSYPMCPMCHESMNPAHYQKVSGVVVHRCATCGVWLDGNNAAKFFFLFEAGRMAELEQRAGRATTEDLEARVAKLEKQQTLPPSSIAIRDDIVADADPSGIFTVAGLFAFLGSLFRD